MRTTHHDDHDLWQTTTVVDEEAVDHERTIGTVTVTGDTVLVRVAQRIDYDLLTEPVQAHPYPPRITLGGMFELDHPTQARQIAAYLIEAATFMETIVKRRA